MGMKCWLWLGRGMRWEGYCSYRVRVVIQFIVSPCKNVPLLEMILQLSCKVDILHKCTCTYIDIDSGGTKLPQ